MANQLTKTDQVNIVFCGEAGQGIDTLSVILMKTIKDAGYNVFATKESMSRIRGGANSTDLLISSEKVMAGLGRIDILFPLSENAIDHVKDRISNETIVIGEKANLGDKFCEECPICEIAFSELAKDIGGKIYENTIVAGIVASLFKVEQKLLEDILTNRFAKKSEEIVNNNLEAVKKGYEVGQNLLNEKNFKVEVKHSDQAKEDMILNGSTAVALGCIAGGCNYISSYPMSPSTGVLTVLANQGKEFDIIAEQAEDEIAAINMALGAWYAGARGMASTSGGGFALMEEGMSLAGMIESPFVVHLAQRPGPATGLPTRTEQGDLNLALYAGHGDFPRIIYTPGNLEQCFYLAHKAFNMADQYQIPVILLTDQYGLDSAYNVPEFDMTDVVNEYHTVETDENYKRYQLTDTGLSPRGIPGHGKGLVVLDSDEHTEEGHITEDLDVRVSMVDKRMKKENLLANNIIPPELIGPEDYKTLLVAWGSNLNVLKAVLKTMNRNDIALLHYSQVWPLHPDTKKYLQKAEKVVAVENNLSGQFAGMIKQYADFHIEHKILKYNGHAFVVEELVEKLSEI
jgi:2-oxoglutarate ferredoxin oxidoreductase subunit alpha